MKREIKFRGLRKDGKGWSYGMPSHDFKYVFGGGQYDSPDSYEVIPETVGQYTGLKDKSGKDIYEGDKVMYSDKSTSLVVGFENGSFVLKKDGKAYVYNINPKGLEVIGNIHEK